MGLYGASRMTSFATEQLAREHVRQRTMYGEPITKRFKTNTHYYPRYRRQNLRKNVKECMLKLSELKHIDTNLAGAVAAAGGIQVLNDVSQGTSTTSRVGNQLYNVKLNIRGHVVLAATQAGDLFRYIIFKDKQTDGSAPAVLDILETANVDANYNLDKVGSRFVILADRYVPIQQAAATVTTPYVPFALYKKLNFVTYYTGNAGTVSDISTNGLFVLTISQGGLVGVNMNLQLCVKDL